MLPIAVGEHHTLASNLDLTTLVQASVALPTVAESHTRTECSGPRHSSCCYRLRPACCPQTLQASRSAGISALLDTLCLSLARTCPTAHHSSGRCTGLCLRSHKEKTISEERLKHLETQVPTALAELELVLTACELDMNRRMVTHGRTPPWPLLGLVHVWL